MEFVDQGQRAEQIASGRGIGRHGADQPRDQGGAPGINASPEPFSNIFVSLIEDGIVAVVIALVLAEPLIALAVVLLLAIGIGLILMPRKAIRRG